jgi:hypothetical protein
MASDELAARARGYFEAMEDVMSYLNSLDTEGMTIAKLRGRICSFCTEARPKGYVHGK